MYLTQLLGPIEKLHFNFTSVCFYMKLSVLTKSFQNLYKKKIFLGFHRLLFFLVEHFV